ncbi:MAG: glycosyltransferase family 4 protein [Patescibacteria group bacterium]
MKILQVNKFYYFRGGAERYFLELSEMLGKAGHEVIPFAMRHPENLPSIYSKFFVSEIKFDQRENPAKDIKKIGRMIYSFEAKRKLEELIRHEKPDIAHLHNIYHQISPSILDVLKKHKIPVVMSLHDYKLVCPNYQLYTEGFPCERCRKQRYWNAMLHNCLGSAPANFAAALEMSVHHFILRGYEKNVSAFISSSLFLKNLCERWGWPEKKFLRLPGFVNFDALSGESQGLGEGALYFGRLSHEKGLDVLIQAAKRLPDIPFKIVGSGPLAGGLPAVARRHGVLNICFAPHLHGSELWDEVARARIVVLPSVWYENYPLSLLEAQALGRPIVASNIGGIPEIVLEKKNGLLFSPGDAEDLARKIKALYYDEARLRSFGLLARERVGRENDPARHLHEILKIYEWAMSRNQ